jgi:hypothetical protein
LFDENLLEIVKNLLLLQIASFESGEGLLEGFLAQLKFPRELRLQVKQFFKLNQSSAWLQVEVHHAKHRFEDALDFSLTLQLRRFAGDPLGKRVNELGSDSVKFIVVLCNHRSNFTQIDQVETQNLPVVGFDCFVLEIALARLAVFDKVFACLLDQSECETLHFDVIAFDRS